MRNIELFDEYVAAIFAQLYAEFPVKQRVDARALCGHHAVDDFGGVVGDDGRPSRHFDVAIASLQWLVDNGYLRGERWNFGLADAVLTAHGLEALNAVPASLAARETRGARIVRLMREGSVGMAKEVARAAIATGVGALA